MKYLLRFIYVMLWLIVFLLTAYISIQSKIRYERSDAKIEQQQRTIDSLSLVVKEYHPKQ